MANEQEQKHFKNVKIQDQIAGTPIIGKVLTPEEFSGKEASNFLRSSIQEYARNEINRTDMASLAQAYSQKESDFIADTVAPFVPVTSLVGKYRVFDERTFFDRPETANSKNVDPNQIEYGSSYTNFDLSGKALAVWMSDIDRDEAINMYGSVAKWRKINTLLLARLLMLDREIRVADLYQTTGNFDTNMVASLTAWSGVATVPKKDVIDNIYGSYPLYAPMTHIILPHDVWYTLKTHADVRSDVTVGVGKRGKGITTVDDEALNHYFDTQVVVGHAMYNSTPASSTMTASRIWANYVTPVHLGDPGGDELSPSFAVTFKLKSTSFPNVDGWTVRSYRRESPGVVGGEMLAVGYWTDEQVYSQKLGWSLKAL